MKMLITPKWLRKKIKTEPDTDFEAGGVLTRPECPFNYCDTPPPHDDCRNKCHHAPHRSRKDEQAN